jgi:23S rRNA (cytidine2498-2'-O)-methyltransferase
LNGAVGSLAYCREGFEAELAAELIAAAGGGSAQCTPALVRLDRPVGKLNVSTLVFARQLLNAAAPIELAPKDRAAQMLAALEALNWRGSAVVLETPDTTVGRETLKFCAQFQAPLERTLRLAGRLDPSAPQRLHALFEGSGRVTLALADPKRSSPWPMGVPRLKMPHSAPSRSTLKLEEALLTFLDDEERRAWLKPGMRAVDLGAAPGGWTFLLMQRGLKVDAVDNGPLSEVFIGQRLVTHHRRDGFKFRPASMVDWLVCDIVEKPERVAALIAQWIEDGLARRAIFNLKLPMKKRSAALAACAKLIDEVAKPRRLRLRFKHLYHDREEVTGFVG